MDYRREMRDIQILRGDSVWGGRTTASMQSSSALMALAGLSDWRAALRCMPYKTYTHNTGTQHGRLELWIKIGRTWLDVTIIIPMFLSMSVCSCAACRDRVSLQQFKRGGTYRSHGPDEGDEERGQTDRPEG